MVAYTSIHTLKEQFLSSHSANVLHTNKNVLHTIERQYNKKGQHGTIMVCQVAQPDLKTSSTQFQLVM
jgi:hypothetical protein